jgi:hypothetical protein
MKTIKKPKLLSPLVSLGLFALGIVFVMVPSPIAILCFIGGLLTAVVRVMQAASHFRGHKEEYIAQAPDCEAAAAGRPPRRYDRREYESGS